LGTIVQAVLIGMGIVLAGTIPRNILFLANLRVYPTVPWAVPVTALYLWFFWRYLNGDWPRDDTAAHRRASLRAVPLSARVWAWALLAGGLGIIALVLALRIVNRYMPLPPQTLPAELAQLPRFTVLSLLLAAAPVAGIVEESAFRGYMQGPIERRAGVLVAILITGTMFAIAHLDFTWILWPYYVAVAAIYGMVTYLTGSILPAVVLHTAGNVFSNLELWLYGQAEWQASPSSAAGDETSSIAALAIVTIAMVWAYTRLAHTTRRQELGCQRC
jgi:membrane protease YdiL (CAAX protease family)